jgi:hypothetical protein
MNFVVWKECMESWSESVGIGCNGAIISSLLEAMASLKTPIKQQRATILAVWRRPDEGWVKVNTDAVFDADSCKGSIGVVVQDHNSLVLAAAARWFDSVLDALTAEAIAAKEGMELAVECGFRENCS